ncbi:MAG: gephyrin-like molybdotransferase Glp [Geminicoccaceae bacterium]
MIPVAEAQARVLAAFAPGPVEWVMLDRALDRILAEPLSARHDQPPQAVSAMDGYAVRSADTVTGRPPLRLVGEAPAGKPWAGSLGAGDTVAIYTGSVIPDGADAVLIKENARPEGNAVHALEPVTAGRHIRAAGQDFARGWTGLQPGTLLGPLQLGLAAAMGHGWLPVRRRPRVGLLATGDELRRPGEPLAPGQIVSSNTTTVGALVKRWGGEPVDLGIVLDHPDALAAALDQARGLDLLVTIGGASVGAYDLVRAALDRQGMQLDFWQIAMRPGKPLAFGRLGSIPVLGLPGNPVSAAVCSILFLRGALRRSLALDPAVPAGKATLAVPMEANDRRQDYVRGRFVDIAAGDRRIAVAARQDSAMLSALALGDVLVVRPPFAEAVPAGAEVEVIALADVVC